MDGSPTLGFDCAAWTSWNKLVFLLVGAFDGLFAFLSSAMGTLVFLNIRYIDMNTMETHLVFWREGNLYEWMVCLFYAGIGSDEELGCLNLFSSK